MCGAKSFNLMIVLGMIGLMAFGVLFVSNQSHANSRHSEAPEIRGRYENDTCEGVELWFSPKRGTVLVLCGVNNTNEWGGLIFRVTENNGQRWLGEDAYECSVFVAQRAYWSRVIQRDSYVPLVNFPDIDRMFKEWIRQ